MDKHDYEKAAREYFISRYGKAKNKFQITNQESYVASMADFAAELERRKWVRCDDRLPEHGSYLVTIDEDGYKTVRSLSYRGTWEDDEFIDIEGVIAWMPLPEPCQPHEQEKPDAS